MKGKILIIVFTIMVSGCMTQNKMNVVENIKNNDNILVVSQFEDELSITTVGTTAFTNDYFSYDVSDWKINDYIESEVSRQLKNYNIITSPSLRLITPKPGFDFWTSKQKPLSGDEITQFIKDNNVNYVIVVSPASSQDPYHHTSINLNGFGIYQRGLFTSESKLAYLQIYFWIYDAASKEFIANGDVLREDEMSSWNISKNLDIKWIESESKVDKDLVNSFEDQIKTLFQVLIERNVENLRMKT